MARELKYFSPVTDYSALEAELGQAPSDQNPEYVDKWADLYEDEEPGVDDDAPVNVDSDGSSSD